MVSEKNRIARFSWPATSLPYFGFDDSSGFLAGPEGWLQVISSTENFTEMIIFEIWVWLQA
jgi:hypothetical protein